MILFIYGGSKVLFIKKIDIRIRLQNTKGL